MIFELKDGTNFFEEVYDLWANKSFEKVPPPSTDFEDNVYRVLCPEVRINLTRLKVRALEYLVKILKIVKVNFSAHIKKHCPELGAPIDPFHILDVLYANSNSVKLRKDCEEMCFSLAECEFYGGNIFRSQKLLCDLIRPPEVTEHKKQMFKIDDESAEENEAGLKAKASQASDEESESEESDSNLDMEVDGG